MGVCVCVCAMVVCVLPLFVIFFFCAFLMRYFFIFCATFVCVCFTRVCFCCIHQNIDLQLYERRSHVRFVCRGMLPRLERVNSIDFPNIPGVSLADTLTWEECNEFWQIYLRAGRVDGRLLQTLYWFMKKLEGIIGMRLKGLSYFVFFALFYFFVDICVSLCVRVFLSCKTHNRRTHTYHKIAKRKKREDDRCKGICNERYSQDSSEESDDYNDEYENYIWREIANQNANHPGGSEPTPFGKREPRLKGVALRDAIAEAKETMKLKDKINEGSTPNNPNNPNNPNSNIDHTNSNAMPKVSILYPYRFVFVRCDSVTVFVVYTIDM